MRHAGSGDCEHQLNLPATGRLLALAVTSATRSKLLPDLATVAESGLPGYESIQIVGVFAPAKTPESIIKRLNQEFGRVLSMPDVKERLFKTGAEVVACSPEELAAYRRTDMAMMGKLIKDVGIRTE